MTEDIMVSICCITYNHEAYIADAIESFLNQKTTFNYEILIHDDASTDKTPMIIREYEKKYPDIIQPIYQSENQYSKGVSVDAIIKKKVRGKYIAECEGDDYWIDEYKLKKQVDYMEKHPECTFCFCNAQIEDQKNKNEKRLVIPWLPENRNFFTNENRSYSAGELQLLGFIPTMSFFYPRRILDNPPDWYYEAPVGDNALKLLAASKGYAYYLNETMCTYRFNVAGSATTKWKEETVQETLERCNEFIKMLNAFNEFTNRKYETEIQLSKLTWEVQQLLLKGNYKPLRDKRFNQYLALLSGNAKYKMYLLRRFPFLIKGGKKLKSMIG